VGRVINDKGEVFFPLAGVMRASGLTISEFRVELTKRLSKYIKDPQIDVDVSAFRSQRVYVAGEVRSNAYIQITDQPLRILDAIGQAGGLTPTADMYSVILTRGKVSAPIDLERAYYGGDTSANLVLQGGDILAVPDNQERKVFVIGEFGNAAGINNARGYVLRRGRVSLSEVISDAGGLNPFSAAAGKVFVMRADQNGEPLIYQLNARDPASLIMAEKFPMRPRDVVFASPTDITEFGRFLAQFFPLTSGIATVNSTYTNSGGN
jgi:polysaccharide export outer membrane protein